jgi:hypothetical protein
MPSSLYADDEGSRSEFLKFLLEQGEEPAFLRRARTVNEATDRLFKHCAANRSELLQWAKMYLGIVAKLIDRDWSRLSPFLIDDGALSQLQAWCQQWKPELKAPVARTTSSRIVHSALIQFLHSLGRFNQAWVKFLDDVDLVEINRLRTDFNKHYPVEKACAFGSEDIERLGFVPLPEVTMQQLCELFPTFDIPKLRD